MVKHDKNGQNGKKNGQKCQLFLSSRPEGLKAGPSGVRLWFRPLARSVVRAVVRAVVHLVVRPVVRPAVLPARSQGLAGPEISSLIYLEPELVQRYVLSINLN